MIGRLRGILMDKQPPLLVIDVNGVGYDVEAPMSTFYKLPGVGDKASLYTHLSIREDAHMLYGFFTETERRFFRSLIKVNGIGPKLALTILSGIEIDSFIACINAGDSARLTKLPGVGKRIAERLVVEMRDKLSEWESCHPKANPAITSIAVSSAIEDAVNALIGLGYKPAEAKRLVHSVEEGGMSSETLIRKALQAAM